MIHVHAEAEKSTNSVMGRIKEQSSQIANIDVSLLDDASAEVVTKVIAKLLLDY